MKWKLILISLLTGFVFVCTVSAFENFHHGIKAEKLNYDSLYNVAVPLDQSPEGIKLLKNCIGHYGGREKLENINSLKLEYHMKPRFGNDSLLIFKYWMPDRKYKITRTNKNTAESRILKGISAWFQNTDTTIELDSGRYKAELFSFLTLGMPLAAENERFDGTRYGVRDNDSLAYLYFMKKDSLLMVIGIAPNTMEIVTSEGIIYQEDKNFSFKNIFGNFKSVDGYLLPHSLINISMGMEVANSVLVNATINKEISGEEFKPGVLPQKSTMHFK